MDILNSQLWASLSRSSYELEHSMDPLHRKRTGSYYTALELTHIMMQDLIQSFSPEERGRLYGMTFLEPCVGTGNFVFAYLAVCKSLGFSTEQYRQLINNIYVCDINSQALELYKNNLTALVHNLFDIDLDDTYFADHVFPGLLFDLDSNHVEYVPIENRIPGFSSSNGFDIVVTNPPYKNLKAERSHYKNNEQHGADKELYATIGRLAEMHLKYSTTGTLNIYKMFVEEIIDKYTSASGRCSLLIPASILTDKSCGKLRKFIFGRSKLESVRLISEDSDYVDASQALCAVQLHKGMPNTNVAVSGSLNGNIQAPTLIPFKDMVDETADSSVLVLTQNEYHIRKLMQKHPTIKSLPYISNLRGELDLTLNKRHITKSETPYKLLRGRNISHYQLLETEAADFVEPEFVESTAKRKFISKTRLVCQQIANMAKKRRVSFALAPSDVVLGNSCNFLSVEPNTDGVDEFFLLGVLNSPLIDWFFKLSSSNNHINNYEIDTFPIPVKSKFCHMISDAVQAYLANPEETLLLKINALVSAAYGITNEISESISTTNRFAPTDFVSKFYQDVKHIIPNIEFDECRAIISGQSSLLDVSFQRKPDLSSFNKKVLLALEIKYRGLANNELLNHTSFKLSALDLEMIKSVPQGGSWKDIPKVTVQKSKRLMGITKTGGRTTLYGRIDYSKPSYTITTYFNRPGNGTYVHPVHERVLTVREAARFQTFPDDYFFCGNKTDMLKQVGNAVPVLLAYNIGKRIVEKTGCHTSVDLFSGAGGMTYGFKLAGIETKISNDFAESACLTLKANSPEIDVFCGDITQDETKQRIIQAGLSANADIICGGPPCQGFSLAGFRMANDPRNELFRHFIDIVSGVNPKVIVFENVEGILSYQGGETYRNIIELFSELGYNCEGRKLLAHNYGVPQKRKRVILLCVRKDIGILPSELYPDFITPNEDRQITAYETIADLEKLDCTTGVKYDSSYSSALTRFFRGDLSASDYIDAVRDKRGLLNTASESLDDPDESDLAYWDTSSTQEATEDQLSLFPPAQSARTPR